MIEIPLTKGKVALIDDVDYERVAQHSWCAIVNPRTRTVYAQSRIDYIAEHMHVFIMQPHVGVMVDHRDHDGLNNQRHNLRVCTQSQNMGNSRIQRTVGKTSQYKGVSYAKREGRWRAYIKKDYIYYGLGYYRDEESAALAYNKAAIEMFGEFALTNIIVEAVS